MTDVLIKRDRDKHAQREDNVKGPRENAVERFQLYNVTNQVTPGAPEIGRSREGSSCLALENSDRAPASTLISGCDPPEM